MRETTLTVPVRAASASAPRRPPDALRLLAWVFFGGAAVFGMVATLLGDQFFLRLATEALIYGGLALSVDLLLGRTGLLPLGQALFFGLGAYVSALVLQHWAASFWLALGVAVAGSALAGLVGGLIAIRSKGVYFALISFGLAQVVSKVVFNTRELGASDGIIGVPAAAVLPGLGSADPLGFFVVTLAFIAVLYGGLRYLMDTPLGRQLDAIRTNEHRVPFLGFDPWRYKLAAFVGAACMAGASGALYPMLRGFVSPELMFFQVSGQAVINVIVGGTGTLIGPLYGSVLLTGMRSIVGSFTTHHHIVIGVLFVVVVIVLPRGLVGSSLPGLQRWLDRRAGR
ncbi:MAG: branched-chain amino acid ABC transporter permease [Gammaproteobacteria bacterium]|nr:branched-chain amino acid ABC transporter permease [Gammaproteobacteria bacterium]MBU1440125.1 branched-chain amino acid ABC transporter permease [Gammaproteobacteria bacterium]MBU2287354.1 branched-chain amino acid ABC transporter permease [Gammaproteobacteria bacterium]MBU2410027.1 branched-chain amino acid ABC transporter permease [Gammaproteobacteria bacterium]